MKQLDSCADRPAMVQRLRLVVLIVAVGFQLRSIILAVPPVLPQVREDLGLSFTAAGALTAIPVLALGGAAIPGAILVNRFGARLVVGAGTLALGLAALLRLVPLPGAIYVFSALMALGAAMAQPAMTAIVRASFPGAVQRFVTAFTSSLGLGGLAGATLTGYLLALGGWRGTFLLWAAPALAVGLLWLLAAPGRGDVHAPQPGGLRALLLDRGVWHAAGIFGTQSLIFYASASWIPFLLRSADAGQLSLAMFLLNVAMVPLSAVLIVLPWPWASSRRFYALAAALCAAGVAGFVLGMTHLAPVLTGLLGVGLAMTFCGANALPAVYARRPGQVAGYAAIMLTAGYAISFAGPLLGGVLLDRTHVLTSPFWVIAAATAGLLLLGLTLPAARAADVAEAA